MQADQFCRFDGRTLATEAQWHRAMRGDAPRSNDYPWDGAYRCDLVDLQACGDWAPDPLHPNWIPDPVDGLPSAESIFGMVMSVGGSADWVSDWYDETWLASAASRVDDPRGPATGTQKAAFGIWRAAPVTLVAERARLRAEGLVH